MSKVIVSNICRQELSPELLALAQPGVVPIPKELLAPRQIKITGIKEVPAIIKEHRGDFITTISPDTAAELVVSGDGTYLEQSLLSSKREDYLADPDVSGEEARRVSDSDAEIVAVAVIGDSRSPLAICRNIVSGCQNMDTLKEDASNAKGSSNVFLIEDCEITVAHYSLTQRDGLMYFEEKLFTGISQEKYDNGHLLEEIHYKEGLFHGTTTHWDRHDKNERGPKVFEAHFVEGLKDGLETKWYLPAELDDSLVKRHEKYHEEGVLISCKHWDEDGDPRL